MKIFTVVGARPNFIKIDPELPQTIVHTGQHYDFEMSKAFFEDFMLDEPAFNLECKDKVGMMIDKLIELFRAERPDMVIVFGDTHSSLAGALAAAYCNIKLVHIEAGLRSHNLSMPEEVNRVLIDRLAKVKFCPNDEAAYNLSKEGITEDVFVVGDSLLDALMSIVPIANTEDRGKYILITLHRAANADSKDKLADFFEAIAETKEQYYFPMHPRTAASIEKFGIKIPDNVKVMKPQVYKDMISLISNAKKVITDSGGVQREAYWMSVPVILLREETEWNEILHKQAGILVGNDKQKLLDAIKSFKGRLNAPPVHGANKRIREIIYKYV